MAENYKNQDEPRRETIDQLIDVARKLMHHDIGDDEPEWLYERDVLRDRFAEILHYRCGPIREPLKTGSPIPTDSEKK